MYKKLIVGIFKHSSDAEAALNNLSEAEFDMDDVSVIMQDEKQAIQIADPAGPLKGISADKAAEKLMKLDVPQHQAFMYHHALGDGNIVIAMYVDDVAEDVAKEILESQNSEHLFVI